MKSKVTMEAGSVNIKEIADKDGILELFASHVETPKGVTADHLSNV